MISLHFKWNVEDPDPIRRGIEDARDLNWYLLGELVPDKYD